MIVTAHARPLALLLLAGCAAGRAAAPPPSPAAAGPTLSVQVDALTPGAAAPRPIRTGDALHSGDGVALSLSVDRPGYVYALYYSRSGWSQLLYPGGEERPLPAGEVLRVPVDGRRLTLDEETGEETFYALAAPRPIRDLLPGFCARYRLHCPEDAAAPLVRGADSPPPPPPPPPLGTDPQDRGGKKEDAQQAPPDARGVAVLRLSFPHVP